MLLLLPLLLLLQGSPSHLRLPHTHGQQDWSQGVEAAPQEGPQEPVPSQHTLISGQEDVEGGPALTGACLTTALAAGWCC